MFSTCLFCHANLGANESIEYFPVGRRLAFDAAKGRLWAVCTACERWNFTPLEERWEAIEECERLFRDTKLRVSTEHVGLAKLREGTTLIRIGAPQRPEMAAWRYGDQFHRRRKKHLLMVAGATTVVGGYVVAGPMLGLLGGAGFNLLNIPNLLFAYRTVARVTVKDSVLRLNRAMLNRVWLSRDAEQRVSIEVPYKADREVIRISAFYRASFEHRVTLDGAEATAAAGQLLPRINATGGSRSTVADAVEVLQNHRDPQALMDRLASSAERRGWPPWGPSTRSDGAVKLTSIPAPLRLALEMSLHEDDERRALEGELSVLEGRWREAEEIAAISDDMFVSSGVTSMLKKLRGETA